MARPSLLLSFDQLTHSSPSLLYLLIHPCAKDDLEDAIPSIPSLELLTWQWFTTDFLHLPWNTDPILDDVYIYICEVTNQPDPVLVQIFLAKSSALRRSLAVYQILCFLLCLLLFSQHWHCTLRTAGSDCASCYYVTELLDVQNCGCLPYCQCQEDKETITCVTFESLLEKKKNCLLVNKSKMFLRFSRPLQTPKVKISQVLFP